MEDSFSELINRTVEKKLSDQKCLFSVPCNVIENTQGVYYKVKVLSTGEEFTLPNYSGSALNARESVRVYYTGNTLTSQNAYIGASITKSQGVDLKFVTGSSNLGEILPAARNLSSISFKSTQSTSVFIVFNGCVRGTVDSDFSFEIYLDDVKLSYEPKSHVGLNEMSHISFQLPVEVESGQHKVLIKALGGGNVTSVNCYVWGQAIKYEESYDPTSEADYIYRIENDTAEIIYYIGQSQNPELPTQLEGYPVKLIHATAFNYRDVISAYIPEGYETIM